MGGMSDRTLITEEIKKEMQRLRNKGLPASRISERTIGVAASWRGLGLGRRLLDALLEAARVKGVEAVFLEVRESNVSARGLYERAGFKEVGRIPGYYRNPAEEAVRMVLARTQARQGERRPKYPKERVS